MNENTRLTETGTYRHDDGAECLWDIHDQTWLQMHPLYPTRKCARGHPKGGERRKMRLACRLFGHKFSGWHDVKPGGPLPWATCSRCGVTL